MAVELSMPAPELAERLLAEVPYDQRLTAASMSCLHGPASVDLYSLESAGRFLYMDSLDALREPTSGAVLGYIDPHALVWWLENTLGDGELAAAVREVVSAAPSYIAALEPMRELVARRVAQCEQVAGEHAQP